MYPNFTDTNNFLDLNQLQTLISIADSSPQAFLNDFKNTFIQTWNSNFPLISSACQNNDSPSLQKYVHALNGSSANIGLIALCLFCRKIENDISENHFSDFQSLPTTLSSLYTNSIQALSSFIDQLPPSS